MKVVFLDFDGVLNSEKFVCSCEHSGVILDPTRMALLKRIIDATGANIVLSTSWREHWSKDAEKADTVGREINASFSKFGLTILDKTDVYSRREVEIEAWLMMHPGIVSFVVLDDRLLDSPALRGHFVKTANYLDGIDENNVEDAIRILNS